MGTFVMDMSSYEIERSEAMAPGYSEEVLYAGWVPNLACHQRCDEKPALPAEMRGINVEAFLRKMYTCQR
ncbi:MAG: hypothetical protein K2P67_00975 [Gallionellaceae bacterium]|nr:hypothetical protein [Gallionellaceae bacterium]